MTDDTSLESADDHGHAAGGSTNASVAGVKNYITDDGPRPLSENA